MLKPKTMNPFGPNEKWIFLRITKGRKGSKVIMKLLDSCFLVFLDQLGQQERDIKLES